MCQIKTANDTDGDSDIDKKSGIKKIKADFKQFFFSQKYVYNKDFLKNVLKFTKGMFRL